MTIEYELKTGDTVLVSGMGFLGLEIYLGTVHEIKSSTKAVVDFGPDVVVHQRFETHDKSRIKLIK